MMLCPKLDKTIDAYIEKLAYIFENKNIKSISIVHMEVPCCSGVEIIVKRALEGVNDSTSTKGNTPIVPKVITIKDYTISISGEII